MVSRTIISLFVSFEISFTAEWQSSHILRFLITRMGAVGGVSIRAYAIAKRDCWGRDEREGYFGLKDFFMANIDRSLFGGLRWKKSKFLWLLV